MKKALSFTLTLCVLLSICMVCAYAVDPVAEVSFSSGTSATYTTVQDALNAAQSGDIVFLLSNATLSTDATVKSGCTLVVPYCADDEGSIDGENNTSGAAPITGNPYLTLTIASNAKLTINGTVIVSGNQQSTQPQTGCLTGDYGKIDLSGEIEVANGGELYARGEISGTGSVTAKSGSAVYQLFQIRDWRGGTAARAAMNSDIFPFNRYEYNNITADVVYENGAELYGQYYFVVSGSIFGYHFSIPTQGSLPLIGANGMLIFTGNTATDKITTTYSNGMIQAVVDGAVQTGDLALSVNLFGITFPIDSSSVVLPFGYNFDITVADDASLTVTNDIKLLPGCDLTVENGGTMTIANGGSLYFYDTDAYSNTFSFNGTWTPTVDATLTVESGGTVNYNSTYGKLASSDSTGGNFDGITMPANPGTTTVYEYANNTTVTGVTFYYA